MGAMTTKPTEPDLIEEVEELLAKATPEPWFDFDAGEWLNEPKVLLSNYDDAILICRAPDLLRRLVERDKRISNAFLIAYDLAGIDVHPLPEALPETAYVDGYMAKVRELREVFQMIAARVQKENEDAD